MDRPIGFWLKLVDQLIDERFDTTLDEHGVTRRQWQMLNLLRRGPANRAELDAAVAPFLVRSGPRSPGDLSGELPGVLPDELPGDLPLGHSAHPDIDSPAETLVTELDELIESDWVVEVSGSLSLTPRGEISHEKIAQLVDTIREAMSAEVSETDYAATSRTLERMARNLGWAEA
ncbi:MAG: MarR family transcriptional regulator [Microbacteriaceae bacterium]|nr:MarR family transcriptional regulator [Microbacteriaceae bacterium]